jgi:hypothetical protein
MLSSLIEHAVVGSPAHTENLKAFMKKIQGLTIGQVMKDCEKSNPKTKGGAELRDNLLKFAEKYASNKIATLLSGTFRQSLHEQKSRFYVHAPPARAVSKKSLKASDSDSDIKAPKMYKGKYFSKPDRKLKSRGWCLTNVDSKSVASFLKSCAQPDGLSNYWSLWLDDVVSNVKPKLVSQTELVLPVALFDAFVTAACRHLLVMGIDSSSAKVRDQKTIDSDVDLVGKSMESLFHSLCTDTRAKASAMTHWVEWLIKVYDPDLMCLEEFDRDWMRHENKTFWNDLKDHYTLVEPLMQCDTKSQLLILVKVDGSLKYDAERTKYMVELLNTDSFLKSLLRECCKRFDSDETSWLADHESKSAIERTRTRIIKRIVPCVMTDRTGRTVLAVAAHAHSDGTDSRVMLQAASNLRDALNIDSKCKNPHLIVAMDANCKRSFAARDILNGSATQDMFTSYAINDMKLLDCFSRQNPTSDRLIDRLARFYVKRNVKKLREVDELAKMYAGNEKKLFESLVKQYGPEPSKFTPAPPHGMFPPTVNKQRTFVQTQFHKAALRDLSTKDWIFFGPGDLHDSNACECHGLAINQLPPICEESKKKPRYWRQSRAMWDSHAFMPNPRFPSDHALVVSRISWPFDEDEKKKDETKITSPPK